MGSKSSKCDRDSLHWYGLSREDWRPASDCARHSTAIGPDDLCEWSMENDGLLEPVVTSALTLVQAADDHGLTSVTIDCKSKQLAFCLLSTISEHTTTLRSIALNNIPAGCRVCVYDIFRNLKISHYSRLQKLVISRTYMDECYVRLDETTAFPVSVTHLTLYGLGLVSAPPKIANLRNLEHLCLANNIINSVTDILKTQELRKLNILDVSKNCLPTLPDCLDGFPNLTVLDLSHNHIKKTIPERLALLSGLVELYLEWNRIDTIPTDVILSLESLALLDLSFNKIKQISSLVFFHPNLTLLNLAGNMALELTNDISYCVVSALQELDISQTGITQLPKWLTRLVHLKVFKCCDNHVDNIDIVCSLPKLQLVDFKNNKVVGISSLLMELPKLTALISFDLSNNHVEHLPPAILKAVPLQLILDGNPCYNSFTDSQRETQPVNSQSMKQDRVCRPKLSCFGAER